VGGAHRYATSDALSRYAFEPGAEYVFLVTGQNFPDGVTAGGVAGSVDSPVVLVDQRLAAPSADLKSLLTWLQPVRIVIVGTADVIPSTYDSQLVPYASQVLRIGGLDRYETAALLARGYPAGGDVVYVTTGLNWPDGLAAGAAAAGLDAPVLLVKPDEIPPTTASELERLAPHQIVIVGGTASVSDAVLDALGAYADEVVRIGGSDRYSTAALLSAHAFAPGVPAVYLATGQNFPDALGAGAAAGAWEGPLLLVRPDGLPAETAAELARLHPARIVVVGTSDVVADDVISAALAAAS
jgi:putative cell wall-binding protein